MFIFKIAGTLLILLGVLAGLLLLAFPFGIEIQGSVLTFWLLYMLCYVGGFIIAQKTASFGRGHIKRLCR
ncbi:MAG: hypothetical protein D3910_22890 [Candidatus Electrothrix sp. ATG2]|nr:hypothetical protein [Candidatus Electrothrix sp. ATG2]